MKVVHHTIHRFVSGHGRDDDAVFQAEAAQGVGQEHGRLGTTTRQPSLEMLQPLRVPHTQVFVADALRTRQQRVGELLNVHLGVAVHMLKPFGGIAGRVLNFQHLDTAPIDIGLQNGGHVGIGVLGKGVGQVNRVF